jgi:5-formyltetrahydrofolate cyclo-ligase
VVPVIWHPPGYPGRTGTSYLPTVLADPPTFSSFIFLLMGLVVMIEVKSELRSTLIAARAKAHTEEPSAGETLVQSAAQILSLTKTPIVAGYIPYKTEIDLRPLMRALAVQGARLCLPRTPPKGAFGAALTFYLCDPDDPDHLEKSTWGVMEPKAHLQQTRPDVVLVPLLGFDRTGNRLGQGQGHYDRTLGALRATGPVLAVGAAFAAQEVASIPVEPHDQRLDWIITPTKAYPIPTLGGIE